MTDGTDPKVLYPSKPKKVSEHKTQTRETAKLLEDNGYKIFDSSYGMKNVFYLVKEAPDLLKVVVETLLRADETRSLWNYVIGNEMAFNVRGYTPRNHRLGYVKWFLLAPVAVSLFHEESKGASIWGSMSVAERAVHDKYDSNPVTSVDELRLLAGRIVVWQFVKTKRIAMTDEKRNDAADFIAAHLEAVTPLIPELFDRRTLDVGTMETLMNVSTPALLEGAL